MLALDVKRNFSFDSVLTLGISMAKLFSDNGPCTIQAPIGLLLEMGIFVTEFSGAMFETIFTVRSLQEAGWAIVGVVSPLAKIKTHVVRGLTEAAPETVTVSVLELSLIHI